MIERFPKKQRAEEPEDMAAGETAGISEETLREKMRREMSVLDHDQQINYVQEKLAKAPEQIRMQEERTAHLNARIEHLEGTMRSTNDEREQTILRHQLVELQAAKLEYSFDTEDIEDMIKFGADFLREKMN